MTSKKVISFSTFLSWLKENEEGKWEDAIKSNDQTSYNKLRNRKWLYKIKEALESDEVVDYRRTKMMFIGNGEAGKTSTVRGLLGKKFLRDIESTRVGDADQQIQLSMKTVSEWTEYAVQEGDHMLKNDFNVMLQNRLNDTTGKLKKKNGQTDGKIRVSLSVLKNHGVDIPQDESPSSSIPIVSATLEPQLPLAEVAAPQHPVVMNQSLSGRVRARTRRTSAAGGQSAKPNGGRGHPQGVTRTRAAPPSKKPPKRSAKAKGRGNLKPKTMRNDLKKGKKQKPVQGRSKVVTRVQNMRADQDLTHPPTRQRNELPRTATSASQMTQQSRNTDRLLEVPRIERNDSVKRRKSELDLMDSVMLTIWDFAGQKIFYTVHHLFLSSNGIYMLCFDLSKFQEQPANEKEVLRFWLRSVSLHAPYAPLLLIGTHCHGLEHAELKQISQDVIQLLRGIKTLQVASYAEKELFFFPIDNSYGPGNERFLRPIRQTVSQILKAEHPSVSLKEFNRPVSLAWTYLMDILIKKGKQHIEKKEVVKIGQKFRFSKQKVHEILRFYADTGTIMYYSINPADVADEEDNGSVEALSQIIILDPQWLLKSIACMIYDLEIHGSKQFKLPSALLEDVELYETNGILSKTLLIEFWKSYDQIEHQFLYSLITKMKIVSNYIFKEAPSIDNYSLHADADYFVVPAMIRNRCKKITQHLPPKGHRCLFSLLFNGLLPLGVFDHVVCSLVSRSGQIEGSRHPVLFQNFARIWFRGDVISVYKGKQGDRIVLCLSDTSVTRFEVKSYCSDLVEQIQMTFKDRLKLTLKEQGLREPVPRKASITGHHSGQAMRSRVYIQNLKTSKPTVSDGAHPDTQIMEFDCFLAHEWGTENNDFHTHQRVFQLKRQLEEAQFTCWFDEEYLTDNLMKGIVDGVQASRKAIVFVTKRYMDRVEDENNNCTKELSFISSSKPLSNIIVVLFEDGLQNPNKWRNMLKMYVGQKVYIDLSTPAKLNRNFQRLCKEIRAN